ncbi:MAG: FtsH protease activity modulator HflK [Pseudomonadales bacterium]|jgi:membrane protease subunit HflK|nr:FtsH protease activity modulator HflK [Pseudomonadales bacterium]
MAWNEPGNNKPGSGGGNPWGGPPNNKGDIQDLFDKLGGIFGGDNNELPTGKLTILISVALLLAWSGFGFYQLDEQKRAVVLRLGAFHTIVGPGIHWNPPFIDTVIRENVTQQRSYTTQGAMLTEDENIVDVQLSVQYNIGDLRKFTMSIRDPQHALEEATDSAVRHAIGSSKMDDVLTVGRDKIAVDVQSRLQKYLDAYNTGIVVTTVNVEKTQPPGAVQAAFDDVIKAREDEQRVQNEAQTYANTVIPEARGLAKRVFEESLAYRDRAIARAQGEAERFNALLAEYRKAPDVTRERLYIEAMQEIYSNNSKVLIDTQNSSNVLYLPLDQLKNRNTSTGATTDSTTGKTLSPAEIDVLSNQLEEKIRNNKQSSGRADSTRNREAR